MTVPEPGRRPRTGLRGVLREVLRDTAEGLVEIAVTAVVVLVVVGGAAWAGSALAGTAGLVVGALVGIVLLALARALLTLEAVRTLLRRRPTP